MRDGRARSDWPAGLPLPLTSLVGRRRELSEVTALIAAHRLVTLVGSGGVGKTRLAIEVAAAAADGFADGADLIDLSGVTDPHRVPGVAAAALGIEERAGTELVDRVAGALRPQWRLLVLDNCEHLTPACAALVLRILAACPHVTILATSRQSLGVAGEVTWRVPSLSCPGPQDRPGLAELATFSAAALFLDRVRSCRPGQPVAAGEAPAIAAICRRLDGIPLALELAAARTGGLAMTEIARRLTGTFSLLARPGAAPARHETLRASLNWSYQLLAEDERALLPRLSVFANGWSLDSAEAVCEAAPLSADDVARVLASLVDKSLVHADQSAEASRFRLPEVIRAFAAELLAESGEAGSLRARHGSYFCELGSRSAAIVLGPGQSAWLRLLDTERENLLAARLWCGEAPSRAGLGLRLAAGLWEYWHIRGLLDEGARWLEDALGRVTAADRDRADALTGLGVIVSLRGDLERGSDLLAESIELHRQAGDLRGEARAWAHLGNARTFAGDPAGAAALDNALALARKLGDPWHEGCALFMSGLADVLGGDTATARARMAESERLFASAGDYRAIGFTHLLRGDCLVLEGQPADAVPELRAGMRLLDELPDRFGLLQGACTLAVALGAAGNWNRAAFLLGVAESLSERIGAELLPPVQAAISALSTQAERELGPAMRGPHAAGRALGRKDGITAALWPDTDASERPADPAPVLTSREREVADLVAQGLTNRQIAARLVIAKRTADTHVQRILAKLGCSNRAQAAVIVATRLTTARLPR
jgi:predicted ATPase/DNA-binding CsgD family transcriptional regulator